MYSFNLPIPHHIISPQFFLLHLSKKTKQCLVENNAQLQKLYFATQPGTGFIFYFYRGILWISLLIMKTYDFTLQDNMRRTWHWTEVGSNEHNQLYHTLNYISLYSWYIEIYHMQSINMVLVVFVCKSLICFLHIREQRLINNDENIALIKGESWTLFPCNFSFSPILQLANWTPQDA